jgi:septum formation protein
VFPFPVYQIPVILASQSPRRMELMQRAGFSFIVRTVGDIEEDYPEQLQREEIPLYLAKLKADAFLKVNGIDAGTILITADTIVSINGQTLGKPSGRQEAIEMLQLLSGNMHQVYTGVCLTSSLKQHSFFAETKVYFRKLSYDEIVYYTDTCQPYDKAGAYGIQEWIGYAGIEKIEGSFFNVMGLPVQMLYCELCNFIGSPV